MGVRDKYGFRWWIIDAEDGQGGVWTASEKAAEARRRREAQAAAAATAEQAMQSAIDEIILDDTLTARQKYGALMRLTARGYSRREFQMLSDAREAALNEL
jgi:hypothetical protein